MAINMSPEGFGYLLIAIGVSVGIIMIWAMRANIGGYRIKLQHVAFPFIAIAVGVSFVLGLA